MAKTIDERATELGTDLEKELGSIGLKVMTEGATLASLIRTGTRVTSHARGWGDGPSACAMSAAYLAAKAVGIVEGK